MGIMTFEGVVEAGRVRLLNDANLPENATVYVVVPDYPASETPSYSVTIPDNPRIASPRLTGKEAASRFRLEVTTKADTGARV